MCKLLPPNPQQLEDFALELCCRGPPYVVPGQWFSLVIPDGIIVKVMKYQTHEVISVTYHGRMEHEMGWPWYKFDEMYVGCDVMSWQGQGNYYITLHHENLGLLVVWWVCHWTWLLNPLNERPRDLCDITGLTIMVRIGGNHPENHLI